MLVIPIDESIIYVEPVYITTANAAAVPEVKRVIVAYGDRVVMKPSLKECLDALFGESGVTEDLTDDATENEEGSAPTGDNSEIIDAYDRMNDAMRNGDWALFGKALESLGIAIDAIR